ncbi:hypothetical protein ART_0772 [Arthrobacter sp. PAMC 25486]|nr:hypothetical protein ART_0772 [Arthrobacter sp. PAMC 25486]
MWIVGFVEPVARPRKNAWLPEWIRKLLWLQGFLRILAAYNVQPGRFLSTQGTHYMPI